MGLLGEVLANGGRAELEWLVVAIGKRIVEGELDLYALSRLPFEHVRDGRGRGHTWWL